MRLLWIKEVSRTSGELSLGVKPTAGFHIQTHNTKVILTPRSLALWGRGKRAEGRGRMSAAGGPSVAFRKNKSGRWVPGNEVLWKVPCKTFSFAHPSSSVSGTCLGTQPGLLSSSPESSRRTVSHRKLFFALRRKRRKVCVWYSPKSPDLPVEMDHRHTNSVSWVLFLYIRVTGFNKKPSAPQCMPKEDIVRILLRKMDPRRWSPRQSDYV